MIHPQARRSAGDQRVEAWGRRKLAYAVRKQRRGVYVYLKYVGTGGLVAEVERNLKLQDPVVKFMTVQTADEVDLAALQIDPEEIRLGKLELPPEDEKEESREKQLGLVDLGPDAPEAVPGQLVRLVLVLEVVQPGHLEDDEIVGSEYDLPAHLRAP